MRLRIPAAVRSRAAALHEVVTSALRKIEGREVHIYGGMVLVAAGLYPAIGPLALTVVGAVLLYLGVWRM